MITTASPINISNTAGATRQLQASGGATPYTWAVDPTTPLPAGLTMSSAGLITNDGAAALASTPITFIVTDANATQTQKSITVTVAEAVTYSSVILARSPAGYWRLGDTNATAIDSSGNAHDGTYVSCSQDTAALVANAGTDGAVSGNGTSSQVTIGAVSALYFNRSFTIEAWFKPSSTVSGAEGIWSSGYQGFCMRRSGAGIEFLSDYSSSLATVPCGFIAGNTYHVVVTVDASGAWVLYINGASIGGGTFSTTFTGSYVRLGADGRDGTTVANFLSGSLDEVAVYSSALSASDVAANYSAGT